MGRDNAQKREADPVILGQRKSWWEKETVGEGTGRRYSLNFRKAALAAVYLRGEKSIKWVCDQLGISTGAYWLWREEERENPRAQGKEIIRERRERKRSTKRLLRELVG